MDPKPRAVYMLFQSYSEYWPKLAQEHKDNLGVVCNEFLSELIDYAWPKRMREPLRRHFLDPQMKALMDQAQKELDLLMQDMNLEVQPYDPEYEERLKNWHVEVTKDGAKFTEAQEVLEKMLIYYELSAKSFIRNTITQVVERHLLQGMYGIFNSVEILGMTNGTIESIAAENKETRDRRMALKAQKKAIEEAKDICANLAMRKELRMYAEDDLENGEETSEDESPRRSGDRVTRAPSNASLVPPPQPPQRAHRRVSRQPKEETSQAPAQRHPAAEVPEDFYTPSQPSQAPPPPPRPEKVRTEGVGAEAATPTDSPAREHYYPTTSSFPTSGGYTPGEPRLSSPADPRMSAAEAAEYMSRRHQMRKIAGRA